MQLTRASATWDKAVFQVSRVGLAPLVAVDTFRRADTLLIKVTVKPQFEAAGDALGLKNFLWNP